eukprot:s1260_g12.t1
MDEVGIARPFAAHERLLHDYTCKPWRIKSNAPRHCRRTDEHNRRAADVYLQEFRPQERRPGDVQNAIENQPDYIQDLAIALHQYGDFDPTTGRRRMEVLTWYLHGQSHRRCDHPRLIQLDDNFLEWNDDFLVAWRDLLQPRQALHFYVVQPDPPIMSWERHAAQLLLVQQPVHFERATLYTAEYYSPDTVALQRVATFSRSPVSLQYCIDQANIPRQVRHRYIHALYGWQPIGDAPQAPLAIPDGASIVLHIHPPADDPSDRAQQDLLGALWDDDEDEDRPPHPAERFDRSRSPRRRCDDSEHSWHSSSEEPADATSLMARQLHAPQVDDGLDLFSDSAASTSSSAGSTYQSDVQSHFYHIFQLQAPMTAARIRSDTWANMHSGIRFELQLGRHDVQAIHSVIQRPSDLQAANTLVVLIQKPTDLAPGDLKRMVLVDIMFHGNSAPEFSVHRYAVLLRHQITRRILLEDLGLQPYCATVRQKCFVKHNHHLISLANHAPFELQHGDYIRVDLPPHPRLEVPTRVIARCLRDGHRLRDIPGIYEDADSAFEWSTVENSTPPHRPEDEMSLLQTAPPSIRRLTAETVAHAQRPDESVTPIFLADHVDIPTHVSVDFSAVQWTLSEIQQLPLVFLDPWPDDLELLPVTNDYLATLIGSSQMPPTAIHFYVDGSKIGANVGAGIACFVETCEGTFFAGCMSKSVNEAVHSFVGEHAAMAWALFWAIQISDWHFAAYGHNSITLTFNFDAMNTGYQTAGYWRTIEHKPWKQLLRSLAHVLQRRHTPAGLVWEHIKAHSQHPCNEMVDVLAKYAAKYPECVGDCSSWIHWLQDHRRLTHMQWLWYWEHLCTQAHDAPFLQGSVATTFVHPVSEPILPTSLKTTPVHDQPRQYDDLLFQMTFATVNVMTLSTADRAGRLTPTKQQLLLEQFHAAECCVVGLQETRHQRLICVQNDYYHILGHAADAHGQDGVQIWVSKCLPPYRGGPLIQLKHLRIIASSPAYLVIKLQIPHWACLFVTGRAPHVGRPAVDNDLYWHQLAKIIRPYYRDYPVFFLGDTNGHVGIPSSDAIGAWGGTQENPPGQNFHNWLLEHEMKAVNTFAEHHAGDRHTTHVAPNGHHAVRIDFIAAPCNMPFQVLQSWVDETIELGGARLDHLPVLCHCEFTRHVLSAGQPPRKRQPKLNRFALTNHFQDKTNINHFYEQLTTPAWNLDPHQSATMLAHQTHAALHDHASSSTPWRRKHHISEEIWTLVDHKHFLFRQLKAMRKTSTMTLLSTIFSAWRHGHLDERFSLPWIRLHDHATALTMRRLRLATQEVTQAIRQADAHYYQSLATEAGNAYTHEGLTAIWRKIKAVLPKNRLKQTTAQRDLGEGLIRHFADLEAGTQLSEAAARRSCVARNNRNLAQQDPVSLVDISELPTLMEIEDICLKQQAHRAPGLDGIPPEVCRLAAPAIAPFLHNIILKSFLNGIEPFSYKGGRLCTIWKQKQSPDLPGSYRGILLADVYGKILHAWARQRLLPTLLHRRAAGQIGGLPSQQTSTAIQLLKLHGRQGRAKRLSTAVIFVDLRAAFHHLLREYVFTCREPIDQQVLRRFFNCHDFDLTALSADLAQASKAQPKDVPIGLRYFLDDVHKSTWFKLEAEDTNCVSTERGTRPGSPLADLGFNLLMSRLMHIIGAALDALPVYAQGCAALGETVPPISWVDDLAIPLAVADPAQLVPLIEAAVAIIHTTFCSHGMSMNCDQGKS